MLEPAELDTKVDRKAYEDRVPELRVALQRTQYELRDADFPVLVLLAGDDGPGLAETLGVLNEWMDPRSLRTLAFDRPTDEERDRPPLWRYWRVLPAAGTVRLFLGGWTMSLVADRLNGVVKRRPFERDLEHVRRIEKMLVEDGALILKFWLHLGKADAKKQRRKRGKKSPHLHARDLGTAAPHDRTMKVVEEALRRTNSDEAPWQVVASGNARHRNLTVAETILARITQRLEMDRSARASAATATIVSEPPALPAPPAVTVLNHLDMTQRLSKEEYGEQLAHWQAKLHRLSRKARERGVASVLAFEGWDAAGKGGVIRRLSAALDPPSYRVIPISAPTDAERAHHYLWRFWRLLPPAGRMSIFDRSWYGRVLVERVEGLATEAEWRRAYEEITEFESLLHEHGVVLVKFWLHIDQDEQLHRFKEREKTPFKKYKITEDDYRNRARWTDYLSSVHDMVSQTSTELSPWNLVPANDKRSARIQVIRTVCNRLRHAL